MNETFKIPIIKLYDCLIVSIQVALSDHLVMHLKNDVTTQIDRTAAKGLIIDVSGVDLLDSYISRMITDIGLIARLMGTSTVICGMDPSIAMTLVEMDMDLQGIHAALNLENALEYLRDIGDSKNPIVAGKDVKIEGSA